VGVSAYRIFYAFCALLFPIIASGAVFITYRVHPLFGALTIVLLIAWVWHSFSTTCSRCHFYGTSKCGVLGSLFLTSSRSDQQLAFRFGEYGPTITAIWRSWPTSTSHTFSSRLSYLSLSARPCLSGSSCTGASDFMGSCTCSKEVIAPSRSRQSSHFAARRNSGIGD